MKIEEARRSASLFWSLSSTAFRVLSKASLKFWILVVLHREPELGLALLLRAMNAAACGRGARRDAKRNARNNRHGEGQVGREPKLRD